MEVKQTVPEDDIREVKYFTENIFIVKYFRGNCMSGCTKNHGVYYLIGNRFFDIECETAEASFNFSEASFCKEPTGHRMYVEPIIFYIPVEEVKLTMTKEEILEVFSKYIASEHNMQDRPSFLPRQRKIK